MTDDLAANYARAYDNRIGFGRSPALLLIDFARAYEDPDCPLYCDPRAALASALRVRAAARAAQVPVVLTRVLYQPGGIDGGRFIEKARPVEAFIQGRPTAEFAEGLRPEPDELVVTKQYPSAFFGSCLAPSLVARGVDSVILTGLTTSGCVRATCVDAMSHGFITTVVADACGDRHPAPHEANLFDMNAKYADVVSEAEILDHLAALGRDRTGRGR
jgi:maleamate amidohydrolase